MVTVVCKGGWCSVSREELTTAGQVHVYTLYNLLVVKQSNLCTSSILLAGVEPCDSC